MLIGVRPQFNPNPLHVQQLTTRGDLAQMKLELTQQMMQMQADLTKWIVASLVRRWAQ